MRKIIYTKYSNDRDKQFNIKTRIEEDEMKNRYVRKYCDLEQSSNHIQRLYDNFIKLSSVFNENELSMNKCSLIDNCCIEFQYVNGLPLEELISENGNSKQLVEKYINILENSALIDFEISEEFIKYFGNDDYSCLKNKKSLRYSNLDMLFPNILVNDGQWINVDYEWVVDFTIPVDFIIFRALYYSSSDISKEFLYEYDRYNSDEKNVYLKMDKAFQHNVMNNHRYLGEIYESIKDDTFIENYSVNEEKYYSLLDTLANKYTEISQKDLEISQKDLEISQKNLEISQKDLEISQKDLEISQKYSEIKLKNDEINQKILDIKRRDEEICQKNIELELRNQEIIKRGTEISNKDEDIKVLQQIINDMNNSLSFKITRPLRQINSIIKGKK